MMHGTYNVKQSF
jgi:hypothetical protein